MVLRHENFEYMVGENGGVIITGIIDDTKDHFIIPESIGYFSVIKVLLDTNKYVICNRYLYKVKYRICDDYFICEKAYIIDGKYYKINLTRYESIINRILNGGFPSIVGYQIDSRYV